MLLTVRAAATTAKEDQMVNTIDTHVKDFQEKASPTGHAMQEAEMKMAIMKTYAKQVKVFKVAQCYTDTLNRIEATALPGTTADLVIWELFLFLTKQCKGDEKLSQAEWRGNRPSGLMRSRTRPTPMQSACAEKTKSQELATR